MTEEVGQSPGIFEVKSADDFDRVETGRLKYVHLLDNRIIIAPERKYGHWELTGMPKDEAIRANFLNAGILCKKEDGRWQLIGSSGALHGREGQDLMQVWTNDLSTKQRWDKETAAKLNQIYGKEVFYTSESGE